MKFTFVSNYINHHQLPLAKEMYRVLGDDYAFVETEPMEQERIALGWGEDEAIPFCHKYYEEEEFCKKLILESDIVMFGGVEEEAYILDRLKMRKPVIRYAERFYKEGRYKAVSPRGLKKKFRDHTKYRKAPVYLLCAGAYVAGDYQIIQAYPKKKFTWGYFPEKKVYTLNELFSGKAISRDNLKKLYAELELPWEETEFAQPRKEVIDILWAGRMIDWKHPEMVVKLARDLKKEKDLPKWKITMIGGGALEQEIKEMAQKLEVSDKITFTGTMKPAQVRAYMEQADIFLFTSDYREGWGAVMNEAMNSGACVVANVGIGAARSLIRLGENGILYPNKQYDSFLGHVKALMKDEYTRMKMGKAAYDTIAKAWNPENAAGLLLKFAEAVNKEYEKKGPLAKYGALEEFSLPVEGPFSKAKLY